MIEQSPASNPIPAPVPLPAPTQISNSEKTVKKIMIILAVLVILVTILINYAFNITLVRQIIIITLGVIALSICAYIYFKPNLIIRRKREILLLVITILIIFIIIEIILRATTCEWKFEVTPDENIKYRYEPSARMCNPIVDGKRFYFTTNKDGFVDDDFEYNEGDYNIFLIGDSMAACLESGYENCTHQKLEKDLKEEYGDEINIMNFGVSSYSGLAELDVIKEYKDLYKPKMIILYFYVNDLQENQDYLDKTYYKSETQKFIRAITPKTLLFFFTNGKNILDKILMNFAFYRDLSGLEPGAVIGHAMYEKNLTQEEQNLFKMELEVLDEIYQIALEENITLLHVATTAAEQVYEERWMIAFNNYPSLKVEDYNSSKPNSIIMNYAGENGIHHLDLLPLFRENLDYLHWREGHWNDKGQLFAEEKIKEYILENNLIKNV